MKTEKELLVYAQALQKVIVKPFTNYNDVTYEMITTHPYFRTISEEELEEIIEYMNYEGYERLNREGNDKVKNLMKLFDKEKEFILPETWYVKVTEENKKVLSNWKGCTVEVDRIVGMCKWFCSNKIERGHNLATITNDSNYTFGEEITYEQFLKYVLKQEIKTNMKSFKITRSQFKQLYDVACSTWKTKVLQLTNDTLNTFSIEGDLSYEIVEEMFKAISNDNQKKVFTSIFPDFSTDKSIDLSKITDEGLFGQSNSIIQIRCSSDYKDKAFYLSSDYNWELKKDRLAVILIPTRK